jgi:hypothetical protein
MVIAYMAESVRVIEELSLSPIPAFGHTWKGV